MIPVDLEISALGSKSFKLSWSWPKHLKSEHLARKNKQIVKGYNIAYRLIIESTSALDNNKNNNTNNLQSSTMLKNKRNGQSIDAELLQNKNQNFIVKSIESSDQDKERFVLLGLRKHSKYEVKVQAYNSGTSLICKILKIKIKKKQDYFNFFCILQLVQGPILLQFMVQHCVMIVQSHLK